MLKSLFNGGWILLKPSEIKNLRESAGFTQKQMSELFGYSSVRSWQKKEESGTSSRSLSLAEQEYFLLITDNHKTKRIVNR